MPAMDLNEQIPNNVNLSEDKRLLRALVDWQPSFLRWWDDMGPAGFQQDQIYLRTAVSAEAGGWAQFDYVKMPDYRWGIFLAAPEENRTIGFGDAAGQAAWQQVPGEYRNMLRRIIVTQADTEPASVEQQRMLGHSAPSLYDLRNLFQVNVEEGRHLWAMVYLLHSHFGRDGREEAEGLLQRRSGDVDKPRILGAFNEPIDDWLSFMMFTMFTDRDGKYQLSALAESAFDPLSRTTRFMLTEEAHHMFVGETGVGRIVQRSIELTKLDANEDARAQGGIDLMTLQKYVNLWYSLSLDLFGSEVSSNASDFFGTGIKGRHKEKDYAEHSAKHDIFVLEQGSEDGASSREVPMRNALNAVLQDSYVEDCQRGVDRWNKTLEASGLTMRIVLPSRRFHRHVGVYSNKHFTPEGGAVSPQEWQRRKNEWLPSESDRAFVKAVQQPVTAPGQMAHWIAPPAQGIKGLPWQYEYVKRAV